MDLQPLFFIATILGGLELLYGVISESLVSELVISMVVNSASMSKCYDIISCNFNRLMNTTIISVVGTTLHP